MMLDQHTLPDICKVLFWLSQQRTPPAHVAEAMARLRSAIGEGKVHEPPVIPAQQFRDGVRQWGPTGGLFEAQDGEWMEVKI